MHAPLSAAPVGERDRPPRSSRSGFWKPLLVLAAAAAVAAAFYSGRVTVAGIKGALNSISAREHTRPPESTDPIPVIESSPKGAWDEVVEVTADQQTAIGFSLAKVGAQTEAVRLELTARTAYDTDTITKIRPRFDTRVEKVYAKIGQKIKKGEPLVDLYSTDLAAAKTDYQTKYVQWQHDRRVFDIRKELVKTGAISKQVWVDTQNDEQKSRLDFSIAHDKLIVFYEIPETEIAPLLKRVGDEAVDLRDFGNVTDKARMTLRAKADGYVIARDVVPGNYYQSTDVLMEVALLDHLWVWANVYELDQDKVRVGQTIEIQFPYLKQHIVGHVDYVASEVAKDTRAVKIRATIPNPDDRLKSDMLVKALLEIPPYPGQTVIPRLAMVAINGGEFAFVRLPAKGESADADESKNRHDRFERVKIQIAQENTDTVIVTSGLKPGQEIVTNGSLILSQLYEDQRVTVTGLPGQ